MLLALSMISSVLPTGFQPFLWPYPRPTEVNGSLSSVFNGSYTRVLLLIALPALVIHITTGCHGSYIQQIKFQVMEKNSRSGLTHKEKRVLIQMFLTQKQTNIKYSVYSVLEKIISKLE